MSDDRKSSEEALIKKTKKSQYLIVMVVSVLTFLVYLSSLRNEFVNWDDDVYVQNNPYIRSFNVNLFKWAFFNFYAATWHPLTWISHALDYSIWALNPVGHHLTNVILHALNTAVVVMLTIRLLSLYRNGTEMQMASPWLTERSILITGAVTGFLFGLHPIHVESVAWVTERKDLLCALFFLLSILTYTKYVSVIDDESVQKKLKLRFLNKHYLSALGFFVLALLSKPMAVSLPVVLIILDWYPFKRIHAADNFRSIFIEKIPFLSLSLISSIVTVLAQLAGGGGSTIMMQVPPLSTRLLVAVKSLIGYLSKMIVPMNLIPYYPYPKDVSPWSLPYPFVIVVAFGITAICIRRAKKERLWLALWAYYVVTLIPVLGVIQGGIQSMADRYTYLPSLALFTMIGLVTAWSWNKANALRNQRALVKLFGISVFLSLSIALGYLTFGQIGIWKDSMTLWSYAIEKEPESVPIAYNSRGSVFSIMGRFDKAMEDYDKAIALNPSYPEAYNNRGSVFSGMGKFDKAIEDYDKAIALNPSYTDAYYNQGNVFSIMGRFDKAIEDYDKAIALNPSHPIAYNSRGSVFSSMGRFDRAMEDYNKAIALNPSYPIPYNNRGIVYSRMGRFDKAIEDYDKAIALNPSYTDAYYNQGNVFSSMGRFDKAMEDYDKAIALNPSYPEAYNNRGIVYSRMGRFDKAMEDYDKAIALNPSYTGAYYNRGNVFSSMGRFDKAIADFQKVCDLGVREGCRVLQTLTSR